MMEMRSDKQVWNDSRSSAVLQRCRGLLRRGWSPALGHCGIVEARDDVELGAHVTRERTEIGDRVRKSASSEPPKDCDFRLVGVVAEGTRRHSRVPEDDEVKPV